MTTPQNRTVEAAGCDPRELVAVLHNVSQYFNSYQMRALTDVTFTVRRGEVFGLLGPKGSGKSTTLKLLAGRLRPTEGAVKVFGRSPRRPSTKVRISYLAEADGEPAATGWKGFFKRFFYFKQIEQGRSAKELAPGMPRRVHLTPALARNADLIVLDEPFVGLDSASVQEVKELLRSLAQRGKTVVLSGDSVSDAKDICDRLAILFEGKVQAVGTLDQLLAAPDALRFTAPVLPPTISDRVLRIIREDINVPSPSVTPVPDQFTSTPIATAQNSPRAEPAPTVTATETMLTPLLKADPAPAQMTSLPSPKAAGADPVNHRKLAELTKPAADTSSSAKPV